MSQGMITKYVREWLDGVSRGGYGRDRRPLVELVYPIARVRDTRKERAHAIYYAKSAIVEAPGGDLKSRSISANSTVVGQGTVKQHVDVSQSTRNSAASYAYSNLRGKPYNSNFFMNRFEYGSTMNCSQLVWAAYLIKAGIDIDGNGGLGVYPYNIKDSRFTSTYATLN